MSEISMFSRLRGMLPRSETEDTHDFLGVVEIDIDPALGVLVMPDVVTAVLVASGTDYAYSSVSEREAIVTSWEQVLNSARLSIEVFADRRPYIWDLPGALLDTTERQVADAPEGSWRRQRFERWRDAILSGELEKTFPVSELRQYLVIRYPVGSAEVIRVPNEPPMYMPPRRGLRFWESIPTVFGDRAKGLDAWRARRNEAIRGMIGEITRLENDVGRVPGLTLERASGLELVQLLHLLWRGDAAYDEWIGSTEQLDEIRRGEVLTSALNDSASSPETTAATLVAGSAEPRGEVTS